jgi:tetratricopeptide (TPR) repeat protein
VHWVSAYQSAESKRSAEDAIQDSIVQCGRAMNLPNWVEGQDQLERQVEITLAAWKERGPRLVILDNLEDLQAASTWLARLRHTNIRLLITSRQSDWPPAFGLHPLPLATFTEQESLAFLRRSLDETRASDDDLRQLHERFGGLPLPLDLAAAYLQHVQGLRVAEYLQQLSLEHPSLKNWRTKYPNATRHDKDVAATFALSWQRVEDDAARRLFLLAGYYPPNEPLRQDVFQEAAGLDEAGYSEALDLLQGLSLLQPGPSLHPLLAEFARLQDTDQAALFRYARALAQRSYPGFAHGGLYRDPELARLARFSLQDMVRATCLTDRAPEERSALCFHTAFLLTHFGDLDGAMELYQQSLELDERLGDLRGKAVTIGEIARIEQMRGNLDKAIELQEQKLAIVKELGDQREISVALHNLATIYVTRGDLDGAMQRYQQVLENVERLGDLQGKSATLHQMAYVLVTRGDLDGAMQRYRQSLELDERLGDLQGKATTLHQMAYIYVTRGDLDGAMRLYQQSLEIKERLGDLRGKAITLGMMGQALWAQGKHGEALASLWGGLKLLRQLKIEPQIQEAMASVLADWRQQMGAEAFDCLWQQVTGGEGAVHE